MRMVDFTCLGCETRVPDIMCSVDAVQPCPTCGMNMTQDWLPRAKRPRAQWDDHDKAVVFRNHATGEMEYPAINSKPTPPGRERIELRSMYELEKFEKDNHVRSEVAWYDSGSSTPRPDDSYRGHRMTH